MDERTELSSNLAQKHCVPCKGGVPPLEKTKQEKLLNELDGWSIVQSHHLHKTYKLNSFREAITWVNKAAEIAEAEGHHPNIQIDFREVGVDIWTHKIDNLTESDFVLAAKLDRITLS
jgi:4a-hydroxytetrahydrobiopterin dehydratase